MNANKLTELLRIIGTVLLVAALVGGNIWGGKTWIILLWIACIMVCSRIVYELIHFKEYKRTNINLLVAFPIIIIFIWIMYHFHII